MGSFKATVGDDPRKTQAKETTLNGHAKRVKDDRKEAIQEKNHENAIFINKGEVSRRNRQ